MNNVRWIFLKEMRDILRDRRSLFVLVLSPLVLYPLILIGLSQFVFLQMSRLRREKVVVALSDMPPQFSGFLAHRERTRREKVAFVFEQFASPKQAVLGGKAQVWLQGEGTIGAEGTGTIRVWCNSTIEKSWLALEAVKGLMHEFRRFLLAQRLEGLGKRPEFASPFSMVIESVATSESQGVTHFGRYLAVLIVLIAATFPFYPAIDAGAGEKERGTLQTLLVSPATRRQIVAGKFLAIFTVSMAGSALNLASMTITFTHFSGMVTEARKRQREFEVTGDHRRLSKREFRERMKEKDYLRAEVYRPKDFHFSLSAGAAALMLLVLVPLCGLFSAMCLALSIFARSYREGQLYLTPFVILVAPLSMVSALPGIELDPLWAMVPVCNVVLLFRDVTAGVFRPGLFALVCAATAVYAWGLLAVARRLFEKEKVLFREAELGGWRLWERDEGTPVPRPAEGIGMFVAVLLAVWFVGQPMQQRNPAAGLTFTLVALVGLPPVVYSLLQGLDLERTLLLRMPPARQVIGAFLLGAGAFLLVRQLQVAQWGLFGDPRDLAAGEDQLAWIGTLGPVAIVGLFCLLPAVGEELLFRGFILGSLSSRRGVAVALGALMFALIHLSPHRVLFTFALGLALGWCALATRSVVAAAIVHFTSNAAALAVAGWSVILAERGLTGPWTEMALPDRHLPWPLVAAGALLTAAGMALVARRSTP